MGPRAETGWRIVPVRPGTSLALEPARRNFGPPPPLHCPWVEAGGRTGEPSAAAPELREHLPVPGDRRGPDLVEGAAPLSRRRDREHAASLLVQRHLAAGGQRGKSAVVV